MKYFIVSLILAITFFSCSKEKRLDNAAEKMQEFVISISNYARSFDPDFIIIPQNGIELAFNNIDPNDGQNSAYMAAIDGFGVEELFYNGTFSLDEERLAIFSSIKKIMVSEYVTSSNIPMFKSKLMKIFYLPEKVAIIYLNSTAFLILIQQTSTACPMHKTIYTLLAQTVILQNKL